MAECSISSTGKKKRGKPLNTWVCFHCFKTQPQHPQASKLHAGLTLQTPSGHSCAAWPPPGRTRSRPKPQVFSGEVDGFLLGFLLGFCWVCLLGVYWEKVQGSSWTFKATVRPNSEASAWFMICVLPLLAQKSGGNSSATPLVHILATLERTSSDVARGILRPRRPPSNLKPGESGNDHSDPYSKYSRPIFHSILLLEA